jgi:hypothetical protein
VCPYIPSLLKRTGFKDMQINMLFLIYTSAKKILCFDSKGFLMGAPGMGDNYRVQIPNVP